MISLNMRAVANCAQRSRKLGGVTAHGRRKTVLMYMINKLMTKRAPGTMACVVLAAAACIGAATRVRADDAGAKKLLKRMTD
jgi:hypothetical protein